jgi:CRP/FNR family cyclic AMP-dependent transcriptional regulator
MSHDPNRVHRGHTLFGMGESVTGGNFNSWILNFSLFSGLDSDNDLQEILALAKPFSVDAGTGLFRQGDAADGMYAIREGEVAIRVRVPGDTSREISRVGSGGFLGELALLDLGRRSATAIAVRPTSGYFFDEHFFTLLQHSHRPVSHKVITRISHVTCARIRKLIADVARGAAALPVVYHRLRYSKLGGAAPGGQHP